MCKAKLACEEIQGKVIVLNVNGMKCEALHVLIDVSANEKQEKFPKWTPVKSALVKSIP